MKRAFNLVLLLALQMLAVPAFADYSENFDKGTECNPYVFVLATPPVYNGDTVITRELQLNKEIFAQWISETANAMDIIIAPDTIQSIQVMSLKLNRETAHARKIHMRGKYGDKHVVIAYDTRSRIARTLSEFTLLYAVLFVASAFRIWFTWKDGDIYASLAMIFLAMSFLVLFVFSVFTTLPYPVI